VELVRKDVRKLIERAADQGWRVDERRSGSKPSRWADLRWTSPCVPRWSAFRPTSPSRP